MKKIILTALITTVGILPLSAETKKEVSSNDTSSINSLSYKRIKVDGLEVFYREAGIKNKETILFLHGFPSSSHMYRDIMADLSSTYHVIAPDYPGFGLSSFPPVTDFSYTFDNIALVMEHFIDALALKKINLYMQDYGGPVGFRMAAKRPGLIRSLLIQNANAYVEGLGPQVQQIGQLQQANDTLGLNQAINFMLSYEGIRAQYLDDAADSTVISPDSYNMDSYFIERKGIKEIQFALFKNYSSNFSLYEAWHQYFKKYQPPALIVWGSNDKIFITPGAKAYKTDLKKAELHILNGGHFLLEEQHKAVAAIILNFLEHISKLRSAK